MRALCWNGVNDLRVETVMDPEIINPNDVILKVRLSTTCGSDLHLIDGLIPTMKAGDVLGHEFMGEVVDVGCGVIKVKKGARQPGRSSAQLTILASPPVERGGKRPVAATLTRHAGSHSRQRPPPAFGDVVAAECTEQFTRSAWHAGACGQDRISHRIVDLILHRAIARPTASHLLLLT